MSISTLESRIETLERRMDEFTKQSGIIQHKSAKEEFEEFFMEYNQRSTQYAEMLRLFELGLKAISEAESKPIYEEVKKAREAIDRQIKNVRNFYTVDGGSSVVDYLEKLIAIEREAK
jgi:hypothetical protein